MPFSYVTGRYYQKENNEYPNRISPQQLLALHAAANYKLRWRRMGWLADGYVWPGSIGVHHPSTIRSLLKPGLLEGNARGKFLGMGAWDGRSTRGAMLWISAKGRSLLEKITDETGFVFDKKNYAVVDPRAEHADRVIVGHAANELEKVADDTGLELVEDNYTLVEPDEGDYTLVESPAEQDELEEITDETDLEFDEENYTLPRGGRFIDFAKIQEAGLAYDRVAILFFGDDAMTNFPPGESEHVVLPDDIMRQIHALKNGRPPH